MAGKYIPTYEELEMEIEILKELCMSVRKILEVPEGDSLTGWVRDIKERVDRYDDLCD